ncbi:MAG: ABC transporter permease subunit [Myxococcota bacterium]|jgi:ABC-2 type transport system permease protein|nr:ABC transporter permease subunit [Myxococcota bacterium]
MNNTLAIARREFRAYFNSPVAYFVITVFLVMVGILFFVPFFAQDRASMRDFFALVPFLLIFFGPAITMRLIAEERRSGTLEMLLTMPVRDTDVIVGKFIAALGLFLVALLLTLPYAFTVSTFGELDWGPVMGGYLGLLLLGAATLAIGLFASSQTENQIVAFVVALIITMFFTMVDRFAAFMPAVAVPFVEFLSISTHFENAARGVVDSRDVLYFLSLTALALFLSFRALEARRWR